MQLGRVTWHHILAGIATLWMGLGLYSLYQAGMELATPILLTLLVVTTVLVWEWVLRRVIRANDTVADKLKRTEVQEDFYSVADRLLDEASPEQRAYLHDRLQVNSHEASRLSLEAMTLIDEMPQEQELVS